MTHAYFAPALQYFGTPEGARAHYRYDDDYYTGRVERGRENEELRDDAPAAADDDLSLDEDVISVDDDELTVE
jgi:hypothetical protein